MMKSREQIFSEPLSLELFLILLHPAQCWIGAIKGRNNSYGSQMIIISELLFKPAQVWNIFRIAAAATDAISEQWP